MTRRIDDQLSAKFQAAALNFNAAIKKLFGEKYSLDGEQAFSIRVLLDHSRKSPPVTADSSPEAHGRKTFVADMLSTAG